MTNDSTLVECFWTDLAPSLSVQAGIGLGLSIGKATEKGHLSYGSALGATHANNLSMPASVWNIFVAVGSIAFAYSFVRLLPRNNSPI